MGWRDRIFMLTLTLLSLAQVVVSWGTAWVHLGLILLVASGGGWGYLELKWSQEKEGGEWK